jgi:hypothetical protein
LPGKRIVIRILIFFLIPLEQAAVCAEKRRCEFSYIHHLGITVPGQNAQGSFYEKERILESIGFV